MSYLNFSLSHLRWDASFRLKPYLRCSDSAGTSCAAQYCQSLENVENGWHAITRPGRMRWDAKMKAMFGKMGLVRSALIFWNACENTMQNMPSS